MSNKRNRETQAAYAAAARGRPAPEPELSPADIPEPLLDPDENTGIRAWGFTIGILAGLLVAAVGLWSFWLYPHH